MNGLDASTRARCEELAVFPGRPFDIARRFLTAEAADRALALEALFAVLRELPLAGSDPAPGLTQLAWWHKEIEQATEQGSQHPVVQALLETGAISLLRGEDWRDYFHAIGDWLADAVLPNCEALRVRLRDTAGREARIMTAGCKEPDAECVRLLSLVARLAPGRATPSWVPLDLVARYGAEPGPTGVAGLARDLAELGLEGSHALAQTGPVEESVRLLRLTAALSGRLLERLRDEPEARLARGADRLGPIEVFSAWRWARRWPGVGA